MTEVRGRYDLAHPVDLVWRALTEPPLIARWFVEAELRPRAGSAFRLRAPGVPGFDPETLAEVKEVTAPHKLVMRWQSEQLHTAVTWALTPVGGGTRLEVTQVGFLGVRGTERQAQLAETYDEVFGRRLPALLAELAGGAPAALEPLAAAPDRAARSRVAMLAGTAAVLVALLAFGVWALRPPSAPAPTVADREAPLVPAGPGGPVYGAPGSPGGSAPPSTASPGARPGVPASASPSAAGSSARAVPRASAVPTEAGPAVLRAAYAGKGSDLLGYGGEVTVTNAGGRAAPWTVTLTLPALARADRVDGAAHTQTGTEVVLTGEGPLAPGAATTVTFHVLLDLPLLDPQRPVACTIGSSPCSGL